MFRCALSEAWPPPPRPASGSEHPQGKNLGWEKLGEKRVEHQALYQHPSPHHPPLPIIPGSHSSTQNVSLARTLMSRDGVQLAQGHIAGQLVRPSPTPESVWGTLPTPSPRNMAEDGNKPKLAAQTAGPC